MCFVIDARPVAIMAAEVRPQMNGGPQEAVALVAQIDHGHFARLVTDGSHARQTLQGLRRVGQRLERGKFTQ